MLKGAGGHRNLMCPPSAHAFKPSTMTQPVAETHIKKPSTEGFTKAGNRSGSLQGLVAEPLTTN